MYLFGCLPVLLLVAVVMAFAILGRTVQFIGSTLELMGATVVWLWNSFTNLFRSENHQKRTFNPWTGRSNFDPLREEPGQSSSPASSSKIYADSDGEYIDFEEV